MKKILLTILILGFTTPLLSQQKISKEERLQWFKNAKLGIFIHWGIYAASGKGASWPIKRETVSWEEYMSAQKNFTAENYSPERWAELFKKAGARYVVLTSKHHDGFALWDTKYSLLNAKDFSSAGRDLLAPYAKALREYGLKVGFYFSLLDWSHKDYKVDFNRPEQEIAKFYPQPDWQKHLTPHERFIKFMHGQLEELSKRYHPDLLWFDGGWERTSQWWRAEELKDSLLTWNNNIIVNDRLPEFGDYETAEQGMPTLNPKGTWEFCMTLNNHWSYAPADNNYKPEAQVIRTFVEVISKGGNLLLDVGPKPDGTIAKKQAEMLIELGEWINRNKEVVYNTKAGLPCGHFYGPTLLSRDSSTVYLTLFDIPKDYILLKGIHNKVKSIRVLNSNKELKFSRSGGAKWAHIPGILRIEIPDKKSLDKYVTVVAVELEGAVKLYRGGGKHIEEN